MVNSYQLVVDEYRLEGRCPQHPMRCDNAGRWPVAGNSLWPGLLHAIEVR
jgi:hypothetical protein